MLSTRDPPQIQGHLQTESNGIGKGIPQNKNQKKTGVAICIPDKIHFKAKTALRDKEDNI